ncbi:hypothetical protein [Niveispirillum sp. KHB5.9]|uniref:hypothetical protein n=1 Tax=Niveispirillum sp. KHB5.9 TaxID=3400269 RepID=UPI003A845FE0
MRLALIWLLLLAAPLPALALPWDEDGAVISATSRRAEDNPRIGTVMHDLTTEMLADPVMLAALRQASRDNDTVSIDTIIQRDIAWRLQAKRGRGTLLDVGMGGTLSQRLALMRFPRQAVLTDLILTDDRGLLAGATRIPSDYDQSDEAKYMIPATTAPGMVHVENAAYDESADDYVVLASVLLVDPVDGKQLGVLCANFNLAALQRD